MMESSWISPSVVFVLLVFTTTLASGTEWSEWSECTQTCGYGVEMRHRPCPRGDHAECGVAELGQLRRCKVRECPIDGGWSAWGKWRRCTKTCGEGGTRIRFRLCTQPRPRYGGRNCQGSQREITECSTLPPCPVDGGWSDWTEWSQCKARTCRKPGTRVRTRRCNNPEPLHGGAPCDGAYSESESCRKDGCPVHGGWSEWRDSTPCSPPCGMCRSRNQTRTCDNPVPARRGKDCQGQSVRRIRCPDLDTCPNESSESFSSSSSFICDIPSTEEVIPVELTEESPWSSVSSVGERSSSSNDTDTSSDIDTSWSSGVNQATTENNSESESSSFDSGSQGESLQVEENPTTPSPPSLPISNNGDVECTEPSDSSASSYCP